MADAMSSRPATPGPSRALQSKRENSESPTGPRPKRQRRTGSPEEHRDCDLDGYESIVGSGEEVDDAPKPARPKKTRWGPARMKWKLSVAEPRVIFVQSSRDPGSAACMGLLDTLLSEIEAESDGCEEDCCDVDSHDGSCHDSWKPDHRDIEAITNASFRYTEEIRSQSSWVNGVVLPMLNMAAQGLPLEVWSVQGESVRTKYRPRLRGGKTFDHQVDLVVGLPLQPWREHYQRRGIDDRGWDLSHVNSPHTGRRFLTMGVVVKTSDQSMLEAEVQLTNWMAGLYLWSFSKSPRAGNHPAAIGCTVVGEEWRFYIFDGCRDSDEDYAPLFEVVSWGPIRSLFRCTSNQEEVQDLATTLRRMMEYNCSQFTDELFSFV